MCVCVVCVCVVCVCLSLCVCVCVCRQNGGVLAVAEACSAALHSFLGSMGECIMRVCLHV